MYQYTRYYENQSGGGEIGPIHSSTFGVERVTLQGSSSECSSGFLNISSIHGQRRHEKVRLKQFPLW